MASLLPAEFREQALELVELLRPSELGWAWVEADGRPGYMLSRTAMPIVGACAHCARSGERDARLECSDDADALRAEAEDASATLVRSVHKPTHRMQYHIVLHPTFCQPTLLVLGQHCDGSPLLSSEMWAHMSADIQAHRESHFVFTEIEHPSLGTPCFAFHPCRTGDVVSLMRTMPVASARATMSGSDLQRSYLVTWWSTIAPLVNLPNPLAWYYPCAPQAAPHSQNLKSSGRDAES